MPVLRRSMEAVKAAELARRLGLPWDLVPLGSFHKYFDEWAERDLTDHLRRDRNHPSVISWSVGNECLSWMDEAGPFFSAIVDRCRERDDRPDQP